MNEKRKSDIEFGKGNIPIELKEDEDPSEQDSQFEISRRKYNFNFYPFKGLFCFFVFLEFQNQSFLLLN